MYKTSLKIENNLLPRHIAFKSATTQIYWRTRDLTDTSVPWERERNRRDVTHVMPRQASKREP